MQKKYVIILSATILVGLVMVFTNQPKNNLLATVPTSTAMIDNSGTWTTYTGTSTKERFSLNYPSNVLMASTDDYAAKFAKGNELTHTVSFTKAASYQYSILIMTEKIEDGKQTDSYLKDIFSEYQVAQFGKYTAVVRDFGNTDIEYVLAHNSRVYYVKFHNLTSDAVLRVAGSFNFTDS